MTPSDTEPHVTVSVLERGLYTDVMARLEMPIATSRIMTYLIDRSDAEYNSHVDYATDNAVRLIWNNLYYEYYEFMREIQSCIMLNGNHQMRARYDAVMRKMSFGEWKRRVMPVVEEDDNAIGENPDFVSESDYF